MKCQAFKADGTPCQANHITNSNFCFRHDPGTKKASLLASRNGGLNRGLHGPWGQNVKLETPADLKSFLAQVINGVWSGTVPVPVGSSMGFLARCWLDAHEKSQLEVRLDEIEAKLDKTASGSGHRPFGARC